MSIEVSSIDQNKEETSSIDQNKKEISFIDQNKKEISSQIDENDLQKELNLEKARKMSELIDLILDNLTNTTYSSKNIISWDIFTCDESYYYNDSISINIPVNSEIYNKLNQMKLNSADAHYMNILFEKKYELKKYKAMKSAVDILVNNLLNWEIEIEEEHINNPFYGVEIEENSMAIYLHNRFDFSRFGRDIQYLSPRYFVFTENDVKNMNSMYNQKIWIKPQDENNYENNNNDNLDSDYIMLMYSRSKKLLDLNKWSDNLSSIKRNLKYSLLILWNMKKESSKDSWLSKFDYVKKEFKSSNILPDFIKFVWPYIPMQESKYDSDQKSEAWAIWEWQFLNDTRSSIDLDVKWNSNFETDTKKAIKYLENIYSSIKENENYIKIAKKFDLEEDNIFLSFATVNAYNTWQSNIEWFLRFASWWYENINLTEKNVFVWGKTANDSLIYCMTNIYPKYWKEYQKWVLEKESKYYYTQSSNYVYEILRYASLDYQYNKDFDYYSNGKDLTEINYNIFKSENLMDQNRLLIDFYIRDWEPSNEVSNSYKICEEMSNHYLWLFIRTQKTKYLILSKYYINKWLSFTYKQFKKIWWYNLSILEKEDLEDFALPSSDLEENKKILSDRLNYLNNLLTIVFDIEKWENSIEPLNIEKTNKNVKWFDILEYTISSNDSLNKSSVISYFNQFYSYEYKKIWNDNFRYKDKNWKYEKHEDSLRNLKPWDKIYISAKPRKR